MENIREIIEAQVKSEQEMRRAQEEQATKEELRIITEKTTKEVMQSCKEEQEKRACMSREELETYTYKKRHEAEQKYRDALLQYEQLRQQNKGKI